MLLVKTKLAPSNIHGLGVFADEFIPKGTMIWQFVEGFDVELTEDELNQLPKHVIEWVKHYCYLDLNSNLYVVCLDDARFMNHSAKANTSPDFNSDVRGVDVANCDIQPGVEITNNYHLTDGIANYKLRSTGGL
jgi:uncharacterized protein